MKLVILYTLFGYIYFVNASEACTTPTRIGEEALEGECISLDNCEKLKPLVKEDRQYLEKWHCGYDGEVPKVCCPVQVSKNGCYTFSGDVGTCVLLDSCPSIRKRLIKPVSKENLEFVQRSRCDESEDPDVWRVCCDPSDTLTENFGEILVDRNAACVPTASIPDRKSNCCGIGAISNNKIFGGTVAAIDAHPWTVIIEYSNNRELLCGGSLISGRYVLTAAHCLVGQKSLGAVSVRLGEYNTTNKGKDCVETDGGGTDCTEGDISINIESTIVHPQYRKENYNVNDIALIRLAEMAPYHAFIRPICLPENDVTLAPPENSTLIIAGWGETEDHKPSNVKLEANVNFMDKKTCDQKYATNSKTVLGSSQICSGGDTKDSCKGDSGGPLSYYDGIIHELIGVISFGPIQCATIGRPSIYTKVYDYLNWINSNIKP